MTTCKYHSLPVCLQARPAFLLVTSMQQVHSNMSPRMRRFSRQLTRRGNALIPSKGAHTWTTNLSLCGCHCVSPPGGLSHCITTRDCHTTRGVSLCITTRGLSHCIITRWMTLCITSRGAVTLSPPGGCHYVSPPGGCHCDHHQMYVIVCHHQGAVNVRHHRGLSLWICHSLLLPRGY